MTDRELMQQAQPEQEFTTHEEGKDGWSDWVCPDPQSYLMKCCDCGLVHEAQFGVVRYKSETEREDCDIVDDPNLQAVFRMRRSEQWTPKDTAYRPGGLAQPEQCQYPNCKCATENPCLKGLAQPEQEPVSGVVLDEHGLGALVKNGSEDWHCKKHKARRLYTAPPQRTWAGSGDIEDSNAYLAAEREKVAAWMMQRSYATGHGDTIEDLLKELEWQVAEREREECAKVAEYKLDNKSLTAPNSPKEWWNIACQNIRDAIRARGQS